MLNRCIANLSCDLCFQCSFVRPYVRSFISSLLSITCSTCPPLSRLLQTPVKCIKSERSWKDRERESDWQRTEVGNEKQRDKEVSCDLKIILNEKSGNKDNTRSSNCTENTETMRAHVPPELWRKNWYKCFCKMFGGMKCIQKTFRVHRHAVTGDKVRDDTKFHVYYITDDGLTDTAAHHRTLCMSATKHKWKCCSIIFHSRPLHFRWICTWDRNRNEHYVSSNEDFWNIYVYYTVFWAQRFSQGWIRGMSAMNFRIFHWKNSQIEENLLKCSVMSNFIAIDRLDWQMFVQP